MNSRKRLLLIGAGVVVAAAVVIGVVAAANGGSDGASSTTNGSNSASTAANGKSSHRGQTTQSTRRGTGSTVPGTGGAPTKASGVVNADTDAKYGQSPSSGTCAHWSERFINNSTAKVVQITFAPGRASYSRGNKGDPGYKEFPAKAPAPAVLNVAIAPNDAQAIQFMACTDTAPPSGTVALHIAAPSVLRWKWEDGATGTHDFP